MWKRVRSHGRWALYAWGALVVFASIQASAFQGAVPLPFCVVQALFFFGATGVWVSLPIVFVAVTKAPTMRAAPWRWLAIHVVAYALFTVFSRVVARALIDITQRAFGVASTLRPLGVELLEGTQDTLPLYVGLCAMGTGLLAALRQRDLALQTSQTARRIQQNELESRRAQLDWPPLRSHLDRVGERMATDVHEAETELHALAQQMREAFKPSSEARLSEEPAVATTHSDPRLLHVTTHEAPLAAWRWPEIRLRTAFKALLAIVLVALLAGACLDAINVNLTATIYAGSLGRALGAWLALPVVFAVVLNAPTPRQVGWLRFVSLHSVGFGLFGVIWVATARQVRDAAELVLGQPVHDITWAWEWMFEFQRLSLVYTSVAAYRTALVVLEQHKRAQLHADFLDTQLAQSQLEALNARLDPHFLFNALNTLSSLMHEDVSRTRRLLADLCELLASALTHGATQWSLADEQQHLQRFIAFVEARFGERVVVATAFDDTLRDVLVPRFCVQTLVENAVKHNQQRRGQLRVWVRAEDAVDRARMVVSDDGIGFDESKFETGGLQRLGELLHLLHGPDALLRIGMRDGGGAEVTIAVPTQTAMGASGSRSVAA